MYGINDKTDMYNVTKLLNCHVGDPELQVTN